MKLNAALAVMALLGTPLVTSTSNALTWRSGPSRVRHLTQLTPHQYRGQTQPQYDGRRNLAYAGPVSLEWQSTSQTQQLMAALACPCSDRPKVHPSSCRRSR